VLADGTIQWRSDPDRGAPIALEPVYVGAHWVVLRAGRLRLAIWRDALPLAAFRRLSVAARWQRAPARVVQAGGQSVELT
jgi:hypothetical protein